MKPKSMLRSLLLGSTILSAPFLHAASPYTWTPTATGTYNWNNASAQDNWGQGTANFPNAIGDVANLGIDIAAAQTINLNTTITVGSLTVGDTSGSNGTQTLAPNGGSLTFNNAGAGATLTFSSTTNPPANISAGITLNDNLTVTNNSTATDRNNAPNISGKITGTGGIQLNLGTGGAGTSLFWLSNTTNDYSGGFTLNGGKVVTSSNSAAFGTGTLTINSGTVDTSFSGAAAQPLTTGNANVWNGNFTVSTATWTNNGTVQLQNSITPNISGTLLLNNVVSESSAGLGLTKAGSGTLSLQNDGNSFTGPITITQGTVAFKSIADVGAGNSAMGAPAIGNGTISMGSGSNAVGLTYTGTTGHTTARGLTLSGGTGGVTFDQSGTGLIKFTSNLNIPGAAATDQRKTITLQGSTAGTGELAGVIPNATTGTSGQLTTSLTKAGTGTWVLSGQNTYTGATTVNGGTLRVLTGSGTRNTSAVTIANTPGCVFSVQIANANEQWTSSSTLTVGGVNSGLEIDYGSTTPTTSTSQNPIKVTNLTVSGPGTLRILGNAANFTVGQEYPLINFTGTGPAAADPYAGLALSLPAGLSGHLKTIANHVVLVIDSNVALSWNSGNGTWDSGTPWVDGSNTPSAFSAGNSVALGDASGVSGNPVISVSGPSVSPGAVVMNSANRNYTVSGAIAGTGSMTVNAPSRTLTLQGANSYGGVTTINNGTLRIQNPAASALSQTLGGPVVLAGPEVTLESDNTAGTPNVLSTTFGTPARPFGSSANIVCTGGTPGTDNKINLTKAAGFVDAGVFYNGADFAWLETANGFVRAPIYGTDTNTATTMPGVNSANLHLSLTSGYSGAAYSLKTLKLSGLGAIDLTYSSATLTVESILRTGGGTTTISGGNGVRPPGTEIIIRCDGASDQLIVAGGSTGSIFNSAQIVKSGAGTLSLTGNAVLGTPTLVNAGTLEIAGASGRINSGSHSGAIFVNSGTAFLYNSSGQDQTLSGVISGGGSLTKSNVRTLTLSGANTYTGATTINGGTLQIGSGGTSGSISPSSAITNNGTLAINRSDTVTQGTQFASNISGTGGLSKLGSGTLVISGTNSYTGVTSISGGVIEVSVLADGGSNSGIGASPAAAANLVFLGGVATNTLRYVGSANVSTNRAFTTANGSIGGATIESSGTGTLSFTSTPALSYGTNNEARQIILGGTNTGENTFGKVIANNGSGATRLTKNDGGKWILSAANTYTGTTTINGGTLALGANNVFAATNVTIGNGTLDAVTFSDTVGTLDITNAASTINLGSGATLAFAASNGVSWTDVAGTLNITGTFVPGDGTGPGTNPGSLRFGTSNTGLTASQLLQITASGWTNFGLDANGYLTATPTGGGSAYDAWKATNAPTGTPDDDYDGDGVSNAVEFVLGGTSTTNDLSKLPVPATSGTDMTFTFYRKQSSIDPKTALWIEVSTDLVNWTASPSPYTVPDGATGPVNPGVTVVKGTPANFDTVTLTVPQDSSKKFARLKAVITP